MRQTSALYKTLLADPGHIKQSRLIIGGVVYDESQIVTLSTNEALFAEDTLSVGGAIAREIDFSAFLDDSVPRRAQIIHEVRLITSTQASKWLRKGVYYISTRSKDPLTGITTVHGFDAMMAAEQEWKPAQTDIFPMSMKEAVEKTAAILHLALDPRNVYKTGEDYKVGYPVADGNASEEEQVKGLSIRQVWRWIAGAMGANFIINDLGELRLVPVNDATSTAYLADENGDAVTFGGDAILLRVASADSPELSTLGNAAASVQQFPAFEAISRVILKIGGDQGYVSGSDTGRTIEIDCAYGSQTMANDLLAQLQGYVYQPMQADDALIDPAAELGDPVEVAGVYAVLAQKDTLWDMLSAADIAAPGGTGPEDEYGFSSAAASRTQYELAQARSLISKTNDRISMEIYGEDGKGGLNGRMNTFTMGLSGISGQIRGYQETLDGYSKQLADYKLDLDGFSADLEQYSEDVTGYKKETASYKLAVDQFETRVGTYQEQAGKTQEAYSLIDQKVNNITLQVTNNDATASIQLVVDGKNQGAPAEIKMNGLVTFSALGSAPGTGQTKINGGWIDADTLVLRNKLTFEDFTEDAQEEFMTEAAVTEITKDTIKTVNISANRITSGTLDAGNVALDGLFKIYHGNTLCGKIGDHYSLANGAGVVVAGAGNGAGYMRASSEGAKVAIGSYEIGVFDNGNNAGCFSTHNINVNSDRRLKANINYQLTKEEELFMKLRSCSFELKNDPSKKKRWGFIAQDVIAGAKEVGMDSDKLAFIAERNGLYSISYGELTAINTHMIQKLMNRVAKLEAQA